MSLLFKTKVIYLMTLLLGCSFIWISSSYAAPLTVNTLVDENDGSCSDGDCSLRDAIALSDPDGYILFQSGLTGTIYLNSSLVINKNLNIYQYGLETIVIDGQNDYQIFTVMSGTVSINRLTLRNGYSSGNGGCIDNRADLSLSECTIESCTGWNGGGIYNFSGSSLYMNSCTVQGNTASPSEDLAGGLGGGLGLNNISTVIEGSIIRENQAVNGGGVGMNPGGECSILFSEIVNNNASNNGGGLYSNSTWIDITKTTISGNNALGEGGGIYASNSAVDVSNTTISGNAANAHGGGAYSAYSPAHMEFRLSFTTVANNTADVDQSGDGDGGGIYVEDSARIKNTLIGDNQDGSIAGNAHPDISGPVGYSGAVLVSDTTGATLTDEGDGILITGKAPSLGALADNGGATKTCALLPGSPALNKVDDFTTLGGSTITDDQRVQPRPKGCARGDIGAYESDLPCYISAANSLILE